MFTSLFVGVFIGDTRNGWSGTSNPWPGTSGYEWSKSATRVNGVVNDDWSITPVVDQWFRHELPFVPVPGPQDGSTRAYLYIYGNQGNNSSLMLD